MPVQQRSAIVRRLALCLLPPCIGWSAAVVTITFSELKLYLPLVLRWEANND